MLRIADESAAWFTIERIGPMPEKWVRVRVEGASRWFRGGYETALTELEIGGLADSLESLFQNQAGAHEFDASEGDLNITFAMGKRGDLAVSVRMQCHPDLLHELRLFLNIGQSDLPNVAIQIRSLLET